MIILQCPTCGQRLTVSPAAPARLRCPTCLGRIDNPRFGQAGALAPPPLPMPVISLDNQVERDTQVGTIAIIVIGLLAIVGLSMAVPQLAGQNGSGMLIVVGVAVAAVVAVIIVLMRAKTKTMQRSPAVEGVSYLAQAIGGILLGIAVAVGLCIASNGGELLLVGIFAPAVVGIVIVMTLQSLRGFGLGLILAVPAAFLLLIGLCFAALGGGLKGI